MVRFPVLTCQVLVQELWFSSLPTSNPISTALISSCTRYLACSLDLIQLGCCIAGQNNAHFRDHFPLGVTNNVVWLWGLLDQPLPLGTCQLFLSWHSYDQSLQQYWAVCSEYVLAFGSS